MKNNIYTINILLIVLLLNIGYCSPSFCNSNNDNLDKCIDKVDSYFHNLQDMTCSFFHKDNPESRGVMSINYNEGKIQWHYLYPYELYVDMHNDETVETYNEIGGDVTKSTLKSILTNIIWHKGLNHVKRLKIEECIHVDETLKIKLTQARVTGEFVELCFIDIKHQLSLSEIIIKHPFDNHILADINLYRCKKHTN